MKGKARTPSNVLCRTASTIRPGDMVTPYSSHIIYESSRGQRRNSFHLFSTPGVDAGALVSLTCGEACIGDPYLVVCVRRFTSPDGFQDFGDHSLWVLGRGMGWIRASNVKKLDELDEGFRLRFAEEMQKVTP